MQRGKKEKKKRHECSSQVMVTQESTTMLRNADQQCLETTSKPPYTYGYTMLIPFLWIRMRKMGEWGKRKQVHFNSQCPDGQKALNGVESQNGCRRWDTIVNCNSQVQVCWRQTALLQIMLKSTITKIRNKVSTLSIKMSMPEKHMP